MSDAAPSPAVSNTASAGPIPMFDFIDAFGLPASRPAELVSELDPHLRQDALGRIGAQLQALTGKAMQRPIRYNHPVFEAFGLTRPATKTLMGTCAQAKWLLVNGADLPLSLDKA